jgi:hypothetical protein
LRRKKGEKREGKEKEKEKEGRKEGRKGESQIQIPKEKSFFLNEANPNIFFIIFLIFFEMKLCMDLENPNPIIKKIGGE